MISGFAQRFRKFTDGLFLSIRARVILSYLMIVGVGFFFLTRKMSNDVRPRYLEAEEEAMVDIANVLAAMAEQFWSGDQMDLTSFRTAYDAALTRKFSARIYDLTKSSLDLHVYVADAAGRVVFDSNEGKLVGADYSRYNDVYLTLRGKYGRRSTRTVKSDPATSVLYVAAPIFHGGRIAGVLTVAKPLASMGDFMKRTQKHILLHGTAAAAGAVLMGVLFSAWLTYPIRNLITYAKAIRDGRRTARPHLGHSEIRTLGIAFEEMRDALEGKDYVNRYVQTLTHEMKSPVAAIQGAAELLQEEMPPDDRRRFLANIQSETVRIQEVVDSGPGIPDFALPRVFERFYSLPRPDTGRKSSGLGLAFVREVALLHGGEVELFNRPEGGTRALLSLPGSDKSGQ